MVNTSKYDIEHVLRLPISNVIAIFTYRPAIVKGNLVAEVHSLSLMSIESQTEVTDIHLKMQATIEFIKAEQVYNTDMN